MTRTEFEALSDLDILVNDDSSSFVKSFLQDASHISQDRNPNRQATVDLKFFVDKHGSFPVFPTDQEEPMLRPIHDTDNALGENDHKMNFRHQSAEHGKAVRNIRLQAFHSSHS